MGLKPREGGLPITIISDGRVLRRNLRARNLSQSWLDQELASRGMKSPREVFLLTVDEGGKVYFSPREEMV